jgi:hypothetical protein
MRTEFLTHPFTCLGINFLKVAGSPGLVLIQLRYPEPILGITTGDIRRFSWSNIRQIFA